MNVKKWLEPWVFGVDESIEIDTITDQSKQAKLGTAFFALKGFSVDGKDYIEEALQNGATIIITSIPFAHEKVIVIEELSKVLAEIVYRFYNHPEKHLKFIGITGTNGKTSTAWMLYHALRNLGKKPLMIGTLGAYFPDSEEPTTNTTPGVFFLANVLHRAVKLQLDWVVMEVSSHALMLGRVDQLTFEIAIFLNLSHDHLDFHLSFESYYQAKKKLFSKIHESSLVLINGDDLWGRRLINEVNHRLVSFGQGTQVDIKCKPVSSPLHQSTFDLQGHIFNTEFIHPVNSYNFAAAFGALKWIGHNSEDILFAFSKVPSVPGRFQLIEGKNKSIIIDFAHTPDAMEQVLEFLKKRTQGRLITVFGCGGNRDSEKRPIMGRIASTLSDYVVITSDNPRHEDPMAIVSDILRGQQGTSFSVLIDRRKAIENAISIAQSGDFIAILGKGNEKYQIVGDKEEPYQDIEEVNKWLNR